MSNRQLTGISTIKLNDLVPQPQSPLTIIRRYEFNALYSTLDVFHAEVSEFHVLNGLRLLRGLNDTYPGDFHSAYANTLNGDYTTPLENFFDQESCTLVSFFALQLVDIPKPFSRAKSLYSISAAVPKLRFVNMLTRHGRKAKVSKSFTHAMRAISALYLISIPSASEAGDWRLLYSIFNQFLPAEPADSSRLRPLLDPEVSVALENKYWQTYRDSEYFLETEDWLQNVLFDELLEYIPVFSFYVKRVDKLKRKHSRGKSGKYSIV
jgi:hypothetical protein